MIQPIETVYSGYRFRSRLEARWAVFFDAWEVDWSYEREGFVLEDNVRYLPDFLVRGWDFGDVWIEIKPDAPTPEEHARCLSLSRLSGQTVLLIVGEPRHGKYGMTLFDGDYHAETEQEGFTAGWEFGQGRRAAKEKWIYNESLGRCSTLLGLSDDDRWPLLGEDAALLTKAFEAACMARFEHGEAPNNARKPRS